VDGELLPDERDRLLDHIRECPECREILSDFQNQVTFLDSEIPGLEGPPCPEFPSGKGLRHLPLWVKGMAVALFMISCGLIGYYMGTEKTMGNIPSYARVVAPAVWMGQRDPQSINDREKLNPISRVISQQQYRLGLELNREEINWEEVRYLVETINSLRTDLELLSLHLLYIEKNDRPGSFSSSWWEMTGIEQSNESL